MDKQRHLQEFDVTRLSSKPEDQEMFHKVRSGPHTTEEDVTSTSHLTSVESNLVTKDAKSEPTRAESLLRKMYPLI